MAKSQVLLHCANENLVVARNRAWGAVRPGSIRVLLASPRWDGMGVEEDRAARMDRWVVWEHRDREPD
jgi:hypothetical protein